MLLFYLSKQPLSLSLFYPRWLLDGPTVIQSWKMSSSISIIEVNSDNAADINASSEASSLLMPKRMPSKLGITSEIPGRTSVN
jgi:hypothetical protein